MILTAPPSAAATTRRGAAPDDPTEASHDGCELLLVADRTRGATHRFFGGWRFEAVVRSGRPAPGATLFAAPFAPPDLDAPGPKYDLFLLAERPESFAQDRVAFSWTTRDAPGPPDPLAAALGRARDWLAAGGWQQDPLSPTRYRRPARPSVGRPPRVGLSYDAPRLPAARRGPEASAPGPVIYAPAPHPGDRPA